MIIDSPQGRKLCGMFRGRVMQHEGMGRCKVFIPGIYPDDYSLEDKCEFLPSAEQAVSLFGNTTVGNGVYSYPALGSYVWCFFENGDQNRPVYFAATMTGDRSQQVFEETEYAQENEDDAEKDENGLTVNQAKVHTIVIGTSKVTFNENGSVVVESFNDPDVDSVGDLTDDSDSEWAQITIDGSSGIIKMEASSGIEIQAPHVGIGYVGEDHSVDIDSGNVNINANQDIMLTGVNIRSKSNRFFSIMTHRVLIDVQTNGEGGDITTYAPKNGLKYLTY